MDTVISVHMHGTTGRRLVETLQLVDMFVATKVTKLAKACDGHIYCDPCFGPNEVDSMGTLALCKNGDVIPSKGGSQHQAKVLKMLKEDKLKWQRPKYAEEHPSVLEEGEEDSNTYKNPAPDEPLFCEEGQLFTDSASSGDVIQGNLGDCWFLGAISVLATRMELLIQAFWREDQYKQHGMFDFSWHYVVVDDRLPVFSYTNNRAGKPFFARCSNPNELWVPLLEKAYAKLHGSYEALIGGYIDVALSDLTGLCSEQIVMKPSYAGFGEDPFAPKRGEQPGEAFWQRLLEYKRNGTLMGCSIQPDPKGAKNVVAEGSAGQGLYYKHAYGLIDVGEINIDNNKKQRLVKVRNPWGMGEWTGPWSDQTEERETHDAEIQRVFKTVARQVGANAFTTLLRQRKLTLVTENQEEVTEVNQNDGTFFMTFDDWRNRYTHFFAGIDFADEWNGLRVQGKWDETSNGGNTTKSTWINNPRYQLHVQERCHLYMSVSQHDPRGTTEAGIVPIGFHLCTLQEKDNKFEVKEPPKKAPPYYRLYPENVRQGLCNGSILEPTPPALIPGTVIPGVDEDGVPQPAYTLKQAATVDVVMEPGTYCIIPSMYMRTNKDTGKTNMGQFWISVYGQRPVFQLEGGEPIVEEEEISAENLRASPSTPTIIPPAAKPISVPGEAARRQFENMKDEMLAQARAKGIGYREAKREFANVGAMRKTDFKRRMMNLGFKMDEMSDEKVLTLFNGMDKDNSNTIQAEELLEYFMLDIEEDRIVSAIPEKEDEEVPEKVNQEGTLDIHVVGGKDLQSVEIKQHTLPLLALPFLRYSVKEAMTGETTALEMLEENPALLQDLHPSFFHAMRPTDAVYQKRIQELVDRFRRPKQKAKPRGPKKKLVRHDTTPVEQFFKAVEDRIKAARIASMHATDVLSPGKDKQATNHKPINWSNLDGDNPASSSATTAAMTRQPTVEQKLLHSSPYMQSLESKRWNQFQTICHRKAQVFGDKQKQANLPRLIGGRKSGTNTVHCCDCQCAIVVSGKQDNERMCMAQGCVNLFCARCFGKMGANDKFCDDCYLHEHGNMEVLGMQLRSLLLSKLAATDVQVQMLDQIFQELDENHSGGLSRDEFVHFLDRLKMHPPLTPNQVDGVFEELDTDNNGTLTFDEFKLWMMGRESMWSPPFLGAMDDSSDSAMGSQILSPTRRSILHDKATAGMVTFIQSVIDDVFHDAYAMSSSGAWLLNAQPIDKSQLDRRIHSEHVLFQRLASIPLIDNSMEETGGIAKLFSRFDMNGDGSIEMDELTYLVQSIGLNATPVDLRLLAHRLQRSADSNHIYLSDFANFIQRTSPSQERALLDKLIELEQLCKEHRLRDVEVKLVLGNFYLGMPAYELEWMAKQLHTMIGWTVDLIMLQRIALVCTPCIFEVGKTTSPLVCAGDVLLALFGAPSGLAGTFASHSVQVVSSAIQSLFKIEQGDVEEDLEWEKLGQTPLGEMAQAQFVECLLRRGLKLTGGADGLGIDSQVAVALALDALRYRDGQATEFSSTVSRGLFTSLSRYSTLQSLEERVRHILQTMARVGSGQQMYQTVITRTSDADHALNIYVLDPTIQEAMVTSFMASDLAVNGIALFSTAVDPGNLISPFSRGVVTDRWYPELNAYFLGLLKRLRVHYTEDKKHPCLAFLESDALVAKLRYVFSSCRVPFFWAISPASLELSIDQAALDLSKLRLQPCLIQSILKFPMIASFLRQIHSTLRVHFEVINKPMSVWMSWSEFKSCLAGLQNAYTLVQLLPQGNSFHTPPDEGGGCTPQWNFSASIAVKEPKECIHRSDRPVVYVDTQPIVGKPDSTGENKIPFTILPKLDPKKPQKEKTDKLKALHFVVLSVRRTVPKTNAPPSLYCTAYDPTTASDYEVEGTPLNWPVNFFDPDVNKNFEADWLLLLTKLKLGRTITPKLLIRVYNKQPRSDQLIGETEVSVASMMAREGYGIKSWFSIYDPASQACTGQIELHAHFQIRTNGQQTDVAPVPKPKLVALSSTASSRTTLSEASSKASLNTPPKKAVGSSAEVPPTPSPQVVLPTSIREDDIALKRRIEELEKQLKEHEAKLSTSDASDNAKWKRKYDQLRKQATDQQSQSETKMHELESELKAVNEKAAANPLTVDDFSAAATMIAMKSILTTRCPARPYNGLKKAMAAVVEAPGKISLVACEEVLDDFGLALNASQKRNLFRALDPETIGLISIEDFFIKLSGDAMRSLSKSKLAEATPPKAISRHGSIQTPMDSIHGDIPLRAAPISNGPETPHATTGHQSNHDDGVHHTSTPHNVSKTHSERIPGAKAESKVKAKLPPKQDPKASNNADDGEDVQPSPSKEDEPHEQKQVEGRHNKNVTNTSTTDTAKTKASFVAPSPAVESPIVPKKLSMVVEADSTRSIRAVPQQSKVEPKAKAEPAKSQTKNDTPSTVKKASEAPSNKESTTEKGTKVAGTISPRPNEGAGFASDADLHAYLTRHLPQKWDMQLTAKGKPYYRNFNTRSTQWDHPNPDVDQAYRIYVGAKKSVIK
ncbi:Aste57867_2814 [Aphanomyces stellatus]|uniref:Aste57867_2814 protein n=1 Tax=Aphanomyces stellatus TaxID=120398 RepID=A0A485K8C6_9STRA|nr:hypothetical protein As57867_002807 [Aphanomyces stellatus]VFT80002.1 Aste57867_2814 [Aphanomyces stellatus]